jgi:hypothetical protein
MMFAGALSPFDMSSQLRRIGAGGVAFLQPLTKKSRPLRLLQRDLAKNLLAFSQ